MAQPCHKQLAVLGREEGRKKGLLMLFMSSEAFGEALKLQGSCRPSPGPLTRRLPWTSSLWNLSFHGMEFVPIPSGQAGQYDEEEEPRLRLGSLFTPSALVCLKGVQQVLLICRVSDKPIFLCVSTEGISLNCNLRSPYHTFVTLSFFFSFLF